MQFDLLIKGGEVLDPGTGYAGRLDVGIVGERIVAVEHDLPVEAAAHVVDAHGQLVTPGLVDLHTHVFHRATFWGINPEPIAARSGVTTWLDAGSAGAYNFLGLRDFIIRRSPLRLYAFLNLSTIGLTAPTWELANLNYCDVEACCQMIEQNREVLRGVKIRVDTHTLGQNGLEPLQRARVAADRCGLPLMVHIGVGQPPDVEEVLAYLRPGDILTHCCTGQTMRLVDDAGQLLDAARRAWDAGVIMDIGHGAGSFSFATAEALLSANEGRYRPHVISSDIHQLSLNGPLFDLPTCLSKFLALGLSLPDVIRAATTHPAEVLGLQHDVGTLRPGAWADVALFTVHRGRFPLYDIHMQKREGDRLLRNTLTILNGQLLRPSNAEPPAPWIELTDDQRTLVERGHTPWALTANTVNVV